MSVPSLGWEDPLEEGVATHSSILAWRISRTEGSGGLQCVAVPSSRGSSRPRDRTQVSYGSCLGRLARSFPLAPSGKPYYELNSVLSAFVYFFLYSLHVCVLSSFSRGRLFAAPWTTAPQAPLSMGFSRQEYWSGWPRPPPGDLPDPGIKPTSPAALAQRWVLCC